MKIKNCQSARGTWRSEKGLTLVELIVAFAISAFSISGVVYGYMFSVTSAERFAFSEEASQRAVERLEQTRCAQWITSTTPGVDNLMSSNFPTTVVTLDLMGDGTTVNYGTNFTTITTISATPALRKVHVDCVWAFGIRQTLITNSVEMIRSPK